MSTTQPLEAVCPYCKHPSDYTARDPGDSPSVGDLSLCWGCGVLAAYEMGPSGGLTLRKTTAAENADIAAAPEVTAMQAGRRIAMTQGFGPAAAVRIAKQLRDLMRGDGR